MQRTLVGVIFEGHVYSLETGVPVQPTYSVGNFPTTKISAIQRPTDQSDEFGYVSVFIVERGLVVEAQFPAHRCAFLMAEPKRAPQPFTVQSVPAPAGAPSPAGVPSPAPPAAGVPSPVPPPAGVPAPSAPGPVPAPPTAGAVPGAPPVPAGFPGFPPVGPAVHPAMVHPAMVPFPALPPATPSRKAFKPDVYARTQPVMTVALPKPAQPDAETPAQPDAETPAQPDAETPAQPEAPQPETPAQPAAAQPEGGNDA